MKRWSGLAVAGVLWGALAGCGGPSGEYKKAKDLPVATAAGHDHDHAAEGPHHGSLIELGKEEFHAELVIDAKAHALRVYLLGPDAKADATTAAAELSIAVEGGPTLTLKPAAGSAEGKHSTFELVDEKAVHDIAEAGFLHGTLTVQVGEKSFSGGIDVHLHGDHEHMDEAKPAAEKPADAAEKSDAQ